MENDYSLFKDIKEKEADVEIVKMNFNNTNERIKIFVILNLILLVLILIYISLKENSFKNPSVEDKEKIVFIKKFGNETEVSRWTYLDKFNNIFNLYRLYNIYDDYIGAPFNITNKIKDFFNLNLTTDIFDLDNYIKIKNYVDLDGRLEKIIDNGLFVLSLIIDTDLLNIIFDKNYFNNLLKAKKKFPIKIAQFILLSLIFYYYDSLNYEEIISYATNFYNNLVYAPNEPSNTTLL